MNNDQNHGGPAPDQAALLTKLAELQVQVDRLQQTVRDLEEERRKDAQTLAEAQAELEEYRRLAYNWARQQFREEDWKDFREEDYTIPIEDVIAELEKQDRP